MVVYMAKRTFGWIQNPSSFENLKRTVSVFIPNSAYHKELLVNLNNEHFNFKDETIRSHLLSLATSSSNAFNYLDLVGRSYSPRGSAPCDALVQAIIPSQKKSKPYVDNWSADGFIRWAEALGFIDYKEDFDGFILTELGYQFVIDNNDFSQNQSLELGLLRYPPVHRILKLLKDHQPQPLSKFQIGSQLGFMGESGFTSISHELVFEQLAREIDKKEIKRICTNVEGSSDKYARMICGWLCNMGWVEKIEVQVYNSKLNSMVSFGHCFKITLQGLRKLNELEGKSRHTMITKRVSWYMLATNAENKDYLRSRRFAILEFLKSKSNFVSMQSITEYVNKVVGMGDETVFVIKKDLFGLQGMGLDIAWDRQDNIKLISDFVSFKPPKDVDYHIKPKNENLELYKRLLLEKLPYINSEWVELVEISRDKDQSRIFEMKVSEILKKCYGFGSLHLGGVSKPDCISWHQGINNNWGIIIDAKAYKDGFNFPISERDKMVRYIEENKKRDKAINSNEWWLNFPSEIKSFFFLFVSSVFNSNANISLQDIYTRTGVIGGALDVEQLLLGANYIAYSGNSINLVQYLSNTNIQIFEPITIYDDKYK